MKMQKINYDRIDALSKLTGLIMLAVGIDNAVKGNYYIAFFLFGLGSIISIIPLFIEIET